MPRVVITIVTYNGREYVEELFASLKTEINNDCGVIVVDNASTDGTSDWIQENEKEVILIRNTKNTGFTGGQNIAMKRAIKLGAEYVLLLNQDMVVAPGFVKELVVAADGHPNAAALQPLVLIHTNKKEEFVNSWGNAQHYLGFGYAGGYKCPASEAPTKVTPITYASGAAVLYRASVLKKIGLFPEHFFMYQEDLDVSWRMRLAGYEIFLVPRARVFHKYDWQGAAKKYALVERNRLATVFANYHWATLIMLAPALLLWEVALFGSSFFTGWWRDKVQGYRLLCNPIYRQSIKNSRRISQSLRTVSDREVTRRITAIIDFQETSSLAVRLVINPCLWLYWRFVRMFMFW